LAVGTAPDSLRSACDMAVVKRLEDLTMARGHELASMQRRRLMQCSFPAPTTPEYR